MVMDVDRPATVAVDLADEGDTSLRLRLSLGHHFDLVEVMVSVDVVVVDVV